MLSGDPVTTIDSLPDELLFDILVRFPADYLYHRARLVCRRWRRIIQYSDAFTTTHIQQSSTSGLVLSLQSASPPHSIYTTATPDGRIETSELSYICRDRTTANGLVVESNPEALQLHVVNPATKQSFLLPSVAVPRGSIVYYSRCGIAYSSASMKYKVTLPYCIPGQCLRLVCLDIVTVGVDKSWRRVEIPYLPIINVRSLFDTSPVSSEGFLHWGSGRYCVTMNVETEIITWSEVPIPRRHHCYWYYYLSTGRYLTLLASGFKELSWEVWEMRPAESGEWRKVMPNIDLEDKKGRFQQEEFDYGDDSKYLLPLGWVKYPEVLAFRIWGPTKTCIFYNLEKRQINMIDLPHKLYYAAIVHKNSLVWLS